MIDRSSDSPFNRVRRLTSWIAWSAVLIALLGIATVSFSRYRMWQVKAEVESLGGRLIGQDLPPRWFEWLVDHIPEGRSQLFVAGLRSQFHRVTSIELHDSNPRPGLLHRLTCFQFLRSLDLSGCQIEDDDLTALPRFLQLRELNLNDTSITDAVAVHFQKLDRLSLTRVSFSRTRVGDDTVAALSRLDSLETVIVENTLVLDASLKGFRGLRLKWLDLDGTQITDAAIPQLGRQPALEDLGLNDTKITDATLASLTKSSFPNLQYLFVSETNVTSQGIGSLSLPQLQQLGCDGPLTPADWNRLRKLPRLELVQCDNPGYEPWSGGRFGPPGSGGPFARLDSRRGVVIPENEDE